MEESSKRFRTLFAFDRQKVITRELVCLKKNLILLFSLILGIAILVYSWNSSYPLSISTSLDEFVYNNISTVYWLGLPLTLVSLYLINLYVKNQTLKWLLTVCLVMTMVSLSYFYSMLPGSDSRYFRGLTEAFINTDNPANLKLRDLYFEWPNFLILSKITTAVSGLNVFHYEFFTYTVIGFLLITALYSYFFKSQKKLVLIAVTAYFIINYYFLNFQYAPFSLAFSLLLVLFAFENSKANSPEAAIIKVILFTGITLTHAFVPLFYILFLLVLYMLNRNKNTLYLFMLTATIFSAWQLFQASLSFARNIEFFFETSSEYSTKVAGSLAASTVSLDVIAQTFSRFVVIATSIVCVIGFVALLVKKKLNITDKAIFISGLVYSLLGAVFYLLGSRAYSIVFIPLSLGASYLFRSRYKKYLKCLFFVLLILFLAIPLHLSFYDKDIHFQTTEAYTAENFFLDNYNGTVRNLILSNYRVYTYLRPKINGSAYFTYNPLDFNETDVIVYTVGLGRDLLKQNYTIEEILSDERMNLIYSNGISSVAIRR